MSNRFFSHSPLLLAGLAATLVACNDDEATAPNRPSAAVTAAATYSVKDLGNLGGASAMANAINDEGGVVGWSQLSNGRQHAFFWRAGKMKDLGALAGGTSEAIEVNNDDVAVGWSTVANGAQRAVRWQNGRIKNLGTLGGRNSQALAINDHGAIVGWSEVKGGAVHGFIWQNGTMRDIGTLGGTNSRAYDINNAGKVVGGSSTASGEGHAFTWKDGVFKDLGDQGHEYAVATAINTRGQIAGVLGAFADAEGEELDATYPFRFYQDTWTSIGGGSITNDVNAINRDGIVVGSGVDLRDESFRERAFVSQPGSVDILPPLTPGGIDQNRANDINRFGTIVGSSTEVNGNFTGPNHAVLWRRQ